MSIPQQWACIIKNKEVFLGTTSGTLTSLGVTEETSVSISNLNYETTYYWKVVSQNDISSAVDCSELSFTTQSAPVPFISDFENYPSGWFEAVGPYGSPTGTTSNFSQADFGHDTDNVNGKSARINIYGTSTDEYLISPILDLSAGTHYLNFDLALTIYNTTTSTTLGADDYLALLVTQDAGASWQELTRWDANSTIGNTGAPISEIELTGYGTAVQFAFYAFSDTSNVDNDLFIDNFQITASTLAVSSNIIENFSLYPTLVKETISFIAEEEIDTFSVYNLLGQEVFSKKIGLKTAEINLSRLNAGVYIVKVKSGDSIGSYKIIKE